MQVSPRAFVEKPDKKGEKAGEVGIEGTTIEQPDKARDRKCSLAGAAAAVAGAAMRWQGCLRC